MDFSKGQSPIDYLCTCATCGIWLWTILEISAQFTIVTVLKIFAKPTLLFVIYLFVWIIILFSATAGAHDVNKEISFNDNILFLVCLDIPFGRL